MLEHEIADEASMTELACDAALAGDFGKSGDNIVIVAGIPFGASGTTNLLRVVKLPTLMRVVEKSPVLMPPVL